MKHFFAYLRAASPVANADACALTRPFATPPLLRRTAVLLGLLLSSALGAQAQQFFQDDAAATRLAAAKAPAADEPKHARHLTLNVAGMRAALATAPLESSRSAAPLVLTLPLPDGTTQHFRVVESSVMAPALAAKFPELKTYAGVGVEDATATIRFDLTPQGFHAQVLTNTGKTFYIEPVSRLDPQHYLSFFRKDLPAKKQVCGVPASARRRVGSPAQRTATPQSTGAQLRTYRLAVAANGEFTAEFGGTVAGAMAAIVSTINAVVGEYERELAVRLELVANNNLLIYTNAATDPYTNSDSNLMLTQNQANLDAVIGNANYDIGHVFAVDGGGVAIIESVCNPASKGKGDSGIYPNSPPSSTVFITDFVSHEMGHQFGANHSFNSGGNDCLSYRSANTAYEPGSGTTTMCYAGVCGLDDVQPHNDFNFHMASYEEMQDYIATTTCATLTATGNTPPAVTLPVGGLVLPISTPFKLTASGSDANGDPLTYAWLEYDLGPPKARRAAQIPNETPPLFRSFYPVTSPTRYFPQLDSLVANISPIDEQLPSVARELDFRVMLRDMHNGPAGNIGGQTSSLVLPLSVTAAAGPFLVSAPNTAVTWPASSTQTVTWVVAGTDANGVNCATVNIRLSTDGGFTYPIVLLANTPNDGTQAITVPSLSTTTARVMVEAVSNYFFDISNTNFTIQPTALPVVLTTFTATAQGPSAVALAWATASEANSDHFEVERSTNAQDFARIGKVAAAGTSAAAHTYALLDAQLPTGASTLYYRLRQVDLDGSASYSPVRVVALRPALEGLSVFPNPAYSAATLLGAVAGAQVQVLDALGRVVATATADASGSAALTLPAGLATGVYLVRTGTQAARLIVE